MDLVMLLNSLLRKEEMTTESIEDKLRQQILEKIHLAVRTEFFNQYQKNMQFLADDIVELVSTQPQEIIKAELKGRNYAFSQVLHYHDIPLEVKEQIRQRIDRTHQEKEIK